ncbi:hypothetical protein LguiB_007770 [Lonicera macranthoides]
MKKLVPPCACAWIGIPSTTSIAVGLTDGPASIIFLNNPGPNKVQEWKRHEFEFWAIYFNIHQP